MALGCTKTAELSAHLPASGQARNSSIVKRDLESRIFPNSSIRHVARVLSNVPLFSGATSSGRVFLGPPHDAPGWPNSQPPRYLTRHAILSGLADPILGRRSDPPRTLSGRPPNPRVPCHTRLRHERDPHTGRSGRCFNGDPRGAPTTSSSGLDVFRAATDAESIQTGGERGMPSRRTELPADGRAAQVCTARSPAGSPSVPPRKQQYPL